ncbi:major facilitator superfamily domain-containing protein [Infundibulicybe gibba]|nr:major facilitator superfamily domain-containing protein [Infundibulicybe gibba]
MSEDSPLIRPDSPGPSEYAVIPRGETDGQLSKLRRRAILIMVVWCGFIPSFVSATFALYIPQISEELNSAPSTVILGVYLSLLAACLGGLTGAAYSTVRDCIFLGPGYTLLGLHWGCLSKSVPELIVWHFFQSFGAAPTLAVGAGVVGDLYKLEERGQAMGIFVGMCLLGLPLCPFVVGQNGRPYVSWRIAQLALGIISFFTFTVMFSLPETSHTRAGEAGQPPTCRRFLINPLRPLSLLRSPSLLAVSIASLAILFSGQVLYLLLIFVHNPLDPALYNACILSAGPGYLVGALLAGRASHQDGVWYPEDRLRASLSKAMFFVPPLVFFLGLLDQLSRNQASVTLIVLALFVNGLGVGIILGPTATYAVDVVQSRSAEAFAAIDALRFPLISLLFTLIPFGNLLTLTAVAATLSALLALLALGILWFIIRHGDRMRAWVDVGYSATVD